MNCFIAHRRLENSGNIYQKNYLFDKDGTIVVSDAISLREREREVIKQLRISARVEVLKYRNKLCLQTGAFSVGRCSSVISYTPHKSHARKRYKDKNIN
jgi:phosphoglycolate phosphatase-like HAD superfamily hydrolase